MDHEATGPRDATYSLLLQFMDCLSEVCLDLLSENSGLAALEAQTFYWAVYHVIIVGLLAVDVALHRGVLVVELKYSKLGGHLEGRAVTLGGDVVVKEERLIAVEVRKGQVSSGEGLCDAAEALSDVFRYEITGLLEGAFLVDGHG